MILKYNFVYYLEEKRNRDVRKERNTFAFLKFRTSENYSCKKHCFLLHNFTLKKKYIS